MRRLIIKIKRLLSKKKRLRRNFWRIFSKIKWQFFCASLDLHYLCRQT